MYRTLFLERIMILDQLLKKFCGEVIAINQVFKLLPTEAQDFFWEVLFISTKKWSHLGCVHSHKTTSTKLCYVVFIFVMLTINISVVAVPYISTLIDHLQVALHNMVYMMVIQEWQECTHVADIAFFSWYFGV